MLIEMFEDMPIVMTILAVLLLGFVLFCVDGFTTKSVLFTATVIDKKYSAESTSVGTGTAVTSGGHVGVVTTVNTEPEKFLLIVKNESGKIYTADCSPELYYQKEIGNKIDCSFSIGRITGMCWAIYGVR